MIEIIPIKDLNAEISVPGSKYLANRAIVIAALARGMSTLRQIPENDDINNAVAALRQLGTNISKEGDVLRIEGTDGRFPAAADIDVGDSGTLMRFATAFASLAPGTVRISGSPRIRQRPINQLVKALNELGVGAESLNGGFPPVEVSGGGLAGGKTRITGDISSQYISSLLLVAPYAKKDTEIVVMNDLVSKNYVDITIEMMEDFGVAVERRGYSWFKVKSGQRYLAKEYAATGDWSSASYFFGAAAIINGTIKIDNLNMNSKQGEARFTDIMVKMGCMSRKSKKYLQLICLGKLNSIEVDMSDMPDVVQTLAVVACFAQGTTRITNISQLKDKESNRIFDTVNELKKLGIMASATEDSITVLGGDVHPAVIDPHNDHRMAMSFAMAGMKVAGIRIKNPECVNKSFPKFWEMLKEIGAGIRDV